MAHEFDGRKYIESSTHQKEWGRSLIKDLHLKGNERILDLGCGDGFLTALLAEHASNGRVVGIDASRGMIDTAKRHRNENLEFRWQDINHLDFKPNLILSFPMQPYTGFMTIGDYFGTAIRP